MPLLADLNISECTGLSRDIVEEIESIVPGIKLKHSFEDDEFTKHKRKIAQEKKMAKMKQTGELQHDEETNNLQKVE